MAGAGAGISAAFAEPANETKLRKNNANLTFMDLIPIHPSEASKAQDVCTLKS